MRTGIFGGTFNPIHSGHINLAKKFKDALNLDRVIFVPTAIPPHKTANFIASEQDRLNMINIAIKGEKAFQVSTIEYERGGKSYTYDTLCQLKMIYPDDEFYLIIGSDQFLYFNKWYKYQEIEKMATICSATRINDVNSKDMKKFAEEIDLKNYVLLDIEPMIVSSSDVRHYLKSKKYIKDLVPKEVLDYIITKGIYNEV